MAANESLIPTLVAYVSPCSEWFTDWTCPTNTWKMLAWLCWSVWLSLGDTFHDRITVLFVPVVSSAKVILCQTCIESESECCTDSQSPEGYAIYWGLGKWMRRGEWVKFPCDRGIYLVIVPCYWIPTRVLLKDVLFLETRMTGARPRCSLGMTDADVEIWEWSYLLSNWREYFLQDQQQWTVIKPFWGQIKGEWAIWAQ